MKRFFSRFVTLFLLLFLTTACRKNVAKQVDIKYHDILLENVDTMVSPGEDIFEYINGTWLKKNPIPPEEVSWGIGNLIIDENFKKLKLICEAAANAPNELGSNGQKIGDFWLIAMDSVRCDSLGIIPLKSYLDSIDHINDLQSFIRTVAELSNIGACTLLNNYVAQDDKNSDKMSIFFTQGGLGLPNRDYYFKQDDRTKKVREQYPIFISRILQFVQTDTSGSIKNANDIFQFETNLAAHSKKLEELRDPYGNYHSMSIEQLHKSAKNILWSKFLEITNCRVDSCNIRQPEYYSNVDKLISATSINTLKNYLKFHLINKYTSSLSKEIDETNFNFYIKLIGGAEIQKPRWKRSLEATEDAMGELLGQEFVKSYFNEKAKNRYSNMVEAIREVFKDHILHSEWMGQETKAKALIKLATMTKKVGYPDKWKDYSQLKIGRNSYCENLINARKFAITYNRNKLGRPVDRSEWDMTPQTYNAYYNPSNNEIVLPAAIFSVPGILDDSLDDALVYGYAGASTIGHEITHGFDDEGRQFDEKGNLSNWWSKEDEQRFKMNAKKLIEQFNQYVLLDSLHINGAATLGENIADLGGVVLGLDAFKKTSQYKEGKSINGFTPIQRYFMGYALGWLGHMRDQALASRLLTDVHSPQKYRVLGPFVNIPDFYTAFNIQEVDKMFKPDSMRIVIW